MDKTVLTPLRLNPVYVETIWAGKRISELRNFEGKKIGIAREVSSYRGTETTVKDGRFAGLKISEVIKKNHIEILGNQESNQLIRAAYIDAIEDLSVQVHPNQKQAEEIGDYEKSESWYVLEAKEGAYITAGINLTNIDEIKKVAENGTIEDYLIRIPVKQGDYIKIPAGLIHACGKDMLVIEVGSYGGVTYRIYDYGRPRGLDIEKGLEVVDPNLRAEVNSFPLTERIENRVRNGITQSVYKSDVLDVSDAYMLENNGKYKILTCVAGECIVNYSGKEYNLEYTQTLLIPACCNNVKIVGNARLLLSYPN